MHRTTYYTYRPKLWLIYFYNSLTLYNHYLVNELLIYRRF